MSFGYVLRRLLSAIPLLLGISVILYVIGYFWIRTLVNVRV